MGMWVGVGVVGLVVVVGVWEMDGVRKAQEQTRQQRAREKAAQEAQDAQDQEAAAQQATDATDKKS